MTTRRLAAILAADVVGFSSLIATGKAQRPSAHGPKTLDRPPRDLSLYACHKQTAWN